MSLQCRHSLRSKHQSAPLQPGMASLPLTFAQTVSEQLLHCPASCVEELRNWVLCLDGSEEDCFAVNWLELYALAANWTLPTLLGVTMPVSGVGIGIGTSVLEAAGHMSCSWLTRGRSARRRASPGLRS